MNLYTRCDINIAYRKILQEQLDKLDLRYTILGFGEVELLESVATVRMQQLVDALSRYGIEIVESPKNIIVQKIKDTIIELVYMEDKMTNSKVSAFLASRLNHSYGYLSKLFSETTFSSIENYIILQKTERAKQLIATNSLTFTEIAWKLNYSSVAHFSTHFKNATGLTPTAFQRIINKRRTASGAVN
ncbi:MAG: AraC family transcriptional regulator [Saprospiraceae bacterium]|nr:AraC family transcriptional regulator [Saprospiraceae bacterium]